MGWHREEAERDERVREGRRGKRHTHWDGKYDQVEMDRHRPGCFTKQVEATMAREEAWQHGESLTYRQRKGYEAEGASWRLHTGCDYSGYILHTASGTIWASAPGTGQLHAP